MSANGLRRDPPIDKGLLDHSEKRQMDHSRKGGLTVCAFLKIFARA